MYILDNLLILPSADMFEKERACRKSFLKVFATQSALIKDSDPQLGIVCDRAFNKKSLITFVNGLVKKGTKQFPFGIDLGVMSSCKQWFMSQIVRNLGVRPAEEFKGWAPYHEGSALLEKEILKKFIPVSYGDSEDIWEELALILLKDKGEADALFYSALKMYIPVLKAENSTVFMEILFGDTVKLQMRMIRNYFEKLEPEFDVYYYYHHGMYENKEPPKSIQLTTFPVYFGCFEKKIAILVYHAKLPADVTVFSHPSDQTDDLEAPVPQPSFSSALLSDQVDRGRGAKGKRAPGSSTCLSSATEPNDFGIPSITEDVVYGRKVKVVACRESSLNILEDLPKLTMNFQQQLRRCGLVHFRPPRKEVTDK